MSCQQIQVTNAGNPFEIWAEGEKTTFNRQTREIPQAALLQALRESYSQAQFGTIIYHECSKFLDSTQSYKIVYDFAKKNNIRLFGVPARGDIIQPVEIIFN